MIFNCIVFNYIHSYCSITYFCVLFMACFADSFSSVHNVQIFSLALKLTGCYQLSVSDRITSFPLFCFVVVVTFFFFFWWGGGVYFSVDLCYAVLICTQDINSFTQPL